MGLDITFYKRSKLDPRYKEKIGYFSKANSVLTYFGIEESDNCNCIKISKERFEQFRDDLKKELGSHKGIHLPIEYNDYTCVKPNNDRFKTKDVFFGGSIDYNSSYWNSIRSLYRFSINTLKKIEWDKDDVEVICWW